MLKIEYVVSTVKSHPELRDQVNNLYNNAFPNFVDGEKVMRTYWKFFEDEFADHQLLFAADNNVIAIANSAAFCFNGKNEDLHDDGIYWGLKKIAHDYYKQNTPNTLMALQITVNPEYKGLGLSYSCVKELISFGKSKGYQRLVIPIRPSMKYKYPLMDSEKYFNWKSEDGFPFDPWIRVHVKLGAILIKKCKGISISGSFEEWENWTGLKFPYSSEYIIPGALNTVSVDINRDSIDYRQDNVWVVHDLV